MDDQPILRVDCVGKRYGDRRILTSATLTAYPGQIVALLGRNGIGKSTLLKIGAGVLQSDTGVVHFDGVATLRHRLATAARRGLFYLPDARILAHTFTIEQQLRAVRRAFDGPSSDDLVTRLRLTPHLRQDPSTLSGGEVRRAEVALAVQRGPRCLLADEPFRGVAPLDAELLAEEFRRLARGGCAVVITGHEIPVLFDVVGRVIWCTDGTTYDMGPPNTAREHERFQREFLHGS